MGIVKIFQWKQPAPPKLDHYFPAGMDEPGQTEHGTSLPLVTEASPMEQTLEQTSAPCAPLIVRNAGGNVVICVGRLPDGIFDVVACVCQLAMRRVNLIIWNSILVVLFVLNRVAPNCSIFFMHTVLLYDI